MTTLYAVVFIGVFPALWILATVFDHIMPDNSGSHSPKETLDGERLLNREPLP
jgi:hypothetical protein